MKRKEYLNSFWRETTPDRKRVLFCESQPTEYKGHLIYHRTKDCFDVVKDGVCIGMYAGFNGAKKFIDGKETHPSPNNQVDRISPHKGADRKRS